MQPTPSPPIDPNEERSWRYGNIPLYAAAWQVIPAIWSAAIFGSDSQLPGIAIWLLLVTPILAALHHSLFIANRFAVSSLCMLLATSTFGLLAMLLYAGLGMLLLLSIGPKW
jgi:hypothetical protein